MAAQVGLDSGLELFELGLLFFAYEVLQWGQIRSGNKLDDVFTDLIRGEDGIARFWVQGAQQRLTVAYGQNYRVAVVFAPAERDYVCFEPMAALTNAFNLAHDGRYTELQSIPPGSQWQESFWVEPKSS